MTTGQTNTDHLTPEELFYCPGFERANELDVLLN